MTVDNEAWEQPTIPPSVLSAGDLLGRYELAALIGRGGMGEVWKAYDPVRKRHVVVKLLPLLQLGNDIELQRIHDTFIKVEKIAHQSVCPVYDLGEDPRVGYFLVMDFIDGETLAVHRYRVAKEFGAFPIESVLAILRPIAKAIDFINEAGIVHRDIKPQNIMVSHDGSKPQLVDFGLANEIRMSSTRCSRARIDVSGTYPYMSPEQWRGMQQDGRTDQYAFAVVAYELIAGHLPFENADTSVLRLCVLNDCPAEISSISMDANRVIQRAMSKSPTDRFESCDDFVQKFVRALTKTDRSRRSNRKSGDRTNSMDAVTNLRGRKKLKESLFTAALVGTIAASGFLFRDNLIESEHAAAPVKTLRPDVTALPINAPSVNVGLPTQSASKPTVASPTANSLFSSSSNSVLTKQANSPDPQLVQQVEQAQSIANKAKENASSTDAYRYAVKDWETAEKQLTSANEHYSRAEFQNAIDDYQDAARLYYSSINQAREVANIIPKFRHLLKELADIKNEAISLHADESAGHDYAIAKSAESEMSRLHEVNEYLAAKDKLDEAKESYRRAITTTQLVKKIELSRSAFESRIAGLDSELLMRHGGKTWTEVIDQINQANAGEDLTLQDTSYRKAIDMLPAIQERVRKEEIGKLVKQGEHVQVLDLLWPCWDELEPNMKQVFFVSAAKSPTWWIHRAVLELSKSDFPSHSKAMVHLAIAKAKSQQNDDAGSLKHIQSASDEAIRIVDPTEAMEASFAIAQELSTFGRPQSVRDALTQVTVDLNGMNSNANDSKVAQLNAWLKYMIPIRGAAILWKVGDRETADRFSQIAYSNSISSSSFYWDLPTFQAILIFAEANDISSLSKISHIRNGEVRIREMMGSRPYQSLLDPDLFQSNLNHSANGGGSEFELLCQAELARVAAQAKDRDAFLVHYRNGISMANGFRSYSTTAKYIHSDAHSRLAMAEAYREDFVTASGRIRDLVECPSPCGEAALTLGRQQLNSTTQSRLAGIDGAKATLQMFSNHPRASLLASEIATAMAREDLTSAVLWVLSLSEPHLKIAAMSGLGNMGR